ncbi:alkylation response protein AidB-like acyl-CoA dehydrogenase [Bradyrhizobium sp. USDA 4524]|uniref:acyl-CoA dehydrogenase family protein n=1 Tax=unclassified Bradyrhizobium TaxID=2631580 RepID=UPI00209CD8FA|nr:MULTISPECIES: acyl-CoA dehydrogenase family protein [unclassified Bradyrhizobium]MCP1845598.1 alkylation response protein AidB-like acyl-CoA dehydrogenase [Bradyrhizobium sp. USDA 4538]MCP1907079.1 alkylation response protein AidB-like acyl-CoA dehydrogenase [Bradyrhizobium sp. USDA 4537]MCP1985554.1 alkylation response protein AidB-like acyl-CoA dehydrogenase [Bradyrhizobium sp. USDA 4539]
MTIHPGRPSISDDALHERFAPIFETIAAGAVARERSRTLPIEEIRLLKEAGFGALRVPIEFGGLGATLRQTFELLIALAAADSNLPQALRAHFNLVEDLQLNKDEAVKARWLGAIANGALVGVAVTEPGLGAVDRYRTAVTSEGTALRLNGLKYYTTGTLYADHLLVAADQDGKRVTVLVDTSQPGVSVEDDWDGFGQRLTASGTAEFKNVTVSPDRIIGPGYGTEGRVFGTAHVQLILLATLAGIAKRAAADTTDWIKARTRTFTHAVADLPRNDPLVQQVIGQLLSAAFGARATVLAAVDELARTLDGRHQDPQQLDASELAAAQAQVTVIKLVLDAVTTLFEVGGASLSSEKLAIDRHWRNARTIASHNPVIFKLRAVGGYELNGETLPYAWSAGVRSTRQQGN